MTETMTTKQISVKNQQFILRILLGILAIILFFALTAEPSFAGAKRASGVITAPYGAVVREKPGVSYAQVGFLSKGASVKVSYEVFLSGSSTKKDTRWVYIPGSKGYVRLDLISLKYKKAEAYTTTAVNQRKGAGMGFPVLRTLDSGTKVSVLFKAKASDGSLWYRVKQGGKTGYILGKYLRFPVKAKESGSTTQAAASSSSDGNYLDPAFPSAYKTLLRKLHKKHPEWVFKAAKTNLDFEKAVSKMTEREGTNTISKGYAPSYYSVSQGSYNYLKDVYTARDGSNMVAASKSAVRYFMDPRNWLNETAVFMFEDHKYHKEYQTVKGVNKILMRNYALAGKGKLYVEAGKKYDISPLYLAVRSIQELGNSTFMVNGHKFTYNGKTYKNCYNAFNIGAYDSAGGGAVNGLLYANGGANGKAKTYGRKWDSLRKAVLGGAAFIKANYGGNDQDSGYLEHFNVMNGLSNVGTHVYMTAVYAPYSEAWLSARAYKDSGLKNSKIVFYIPVYKNMPKAPSPRPSNSPAKDNNCYLSSLTVGGETLISSSKLNYNTSFTVRTDKDTVRISASAASKTGASIKGRGKKKLSRGTNTFKLVCRASSGVTRTYKIKVIRR